MIVEKGSQRWPGSPRRRNRLIYFATVRSEISKPSFSSSPWIRTPADVVHRPCLDEIANFCVDLRHPPRGRDRKRQYRRKLARCHPMTVSGLTTIRTSDHRSRTRRNVVQNNRSKHVSGGRRRWRLSMTACCRNASTSRSDVHTTAE